jgi:hypothetical protein
MWIGMEKGLQAATDGRPEAIQVADRRHLMENASVAFLTAVQQSMQGARVAVGSDVVDPAALSCAELRQHSGWLPFHENVSTESLSLSSLNRNSMRCSMHRTGRPGPGDATIPC